MEFALIAPLLIGLVFGIFDFGRGMSANITITNSSREGARWLATEASTLSSPYGTSCPTVNANGTSTAPNANSGQSKAWNQMLGANLDLTKVSMLTVYFYKSTNDPSQDSSSGHTAADLTISCGTTGGLLNGTDTVTAGTNSGDSTYTPQTGDWVLFRVKYTYVTVTPIIHQLFSSLTIDQTTTMVLE